VITGLITSAPFALALDNPTRLREAARNPTRIPLASLEIEKGVDAVFSLGALMKSSS
jgi:hypothetical protein